MRQLVSILLTFTILYTTIGVRINEHYCEVSDTTSYSYFEVEDSCCPQPKNSCPFHQKKDDCCSDKISIVHLDHDVHFQPETIDAKLLFNDLALLSTTYKSTNAQTFKTKILKGRAPPWIYQNHDNQALLQVYRL